MSNIVGAILLLLPITQVCVLGITQTLANGFVVPFYAFATTDDRLEKGAEHHAMGRDVGMQ